MSTFALYGEFVHVPTWVMDFPSFRRWLRSDDFPEVGRIAFLEGEVWVDMSKEQLYSHNQVKQTFNLTLGGIALLEERGTWYPDGAYLSNSEIELSCQPDGTFVSFEALETGRVRLIEGAEDGDVELEGSPDMTLEIVSDSSVEKDTVQLRELYWQAGIAEYWLVDVRGERLSFEILRRTSRGYVAVRRQQGWVKSNVFGKSFRLTRGLDKAGKPSYRLEVR